MYRAEKVIDGKTIVLKVEKDDEIFESPRIWDNIGNMVCWHNKYNLGDEHDFYDEEDFIRTLAEEVITYDFIEEKCEGHFKDFNIDNYIWNVGRIEDLWDLINQHYVILPLYLYDHSGITMNTIGFSCNWDSGQVGYIYASKDKFLKETEYSEKELFEEGKAEELLKDEVKKYDQYLTGEVYGFVLEEKVKCECCGNITMEQIESCWGFYGDKYDSNNFEDMKGHVEEKYHELFDELVYV